MSKATLDITRRHKKAEVENSPFSETFQIVGGGTFKGIFDCSHIENNRDGGNVNQKNTVPLIQVCELPIGLTKGMTIRREGWETGDHEYKYNFYGGDKEGVSVLWLF